MKEETNDLVVVLTGEIVKSNLPEFKKNALAVIEAADKPLVTTQDFDDAETTVKKCKESEDSLKVAKEKALNQTTDIKALFEAMDEISAALAKTRLSLDKKVKKRKAERKQEIAFAGIKKLELAIAEIALGLPEINFIASTGGKVFHDAVSGKRKIESMEEAVDSILEFELERLAKGKEDVEANIHAIEIAEEKHPGLFPDRKALIEKTSVELEAVIESRIVKHKLALKEKAEKEAAAKLVAEKAEATEPEAEREPLPHEPEASEPSPEKKATVAPPKPPLHAQKTERTALESFFVMTISMTCSADNAKAIATKVNELIGDNEAVKNIKLARS